MSSLDPVVVIGGCGGLGHHIVRQLLEAGSEDMTVFDVHKDRNTVSGARYIQGSITDESAVRDMLQGTKARTVFHTASPSPLVNRHNPGLFEAINITGTRILLDACLELKHTKAFIYTSSSSVCHDNRSDLVMATEDLPYCAREEQPIFYTYTKAEAEKLVLSANRRNGRMLTVAIRACAIFGEGDNTIPAQIANARTFRGRIQVGDGKNLFDWTYNGNTAYAHRLAAEALLRTDAEKPAIQESDAETMRVDGEPFVITNDEPWPFWKFIQTVGATAGYPVREKDIWIIPAWTFFMIVVMTEWSVWLLSFGRRHSVVNRETARFVTKTRTFDITKAKKRLNYRPLVRVEEGLRRSVQAFQDRHTNENQKTR